MNSREQTLESTLGAFKLVMSLIAALFLYRYIVMNATGIGFFDFTVEKQALGGGRFDLAQARAHYIATRSSLEVPLMYAFIIIHPVTYLLVSLVMRLKIRSARLGLARTNSPVISTRSADNWGSAPSSRRSYSKPAAEKAKPKEREPDWS
ncbi:TPA: hypothetical protein NID02_001597 [Pseudomonas aeruginosa]|nr:hypothetical protein [Pseudomonas aeruginosa]